MAIGAARNRGNKSKSPAASPKSAAASPKSAAASPKSPNPAKSDDWTSTEISVSLLSTESAPVSTFLEHAWLLPWISYVSCLVLMFFYPLDVSSFGGELMRSGHEAVDPALLADMSVRDSKIAFLTSPWVGGVQLKKIMSVTFLFLKNAERRGKTASYVRSASTQTTILLPARCIVVWVDALRALSGRSCAGGRHESAGLENRIFHKSAEGYNCIRSWAVLDEL